LPCAQGHDVYRQIEAHARRKAKHRSIAENYSFEILVCKVTKQILDTQLAFGVQGNGATFVVFGELFARAVSVDGGRARVHITTDTSFLGQLGQPHSTFEVYRSCEVRADFGRSIVAQTSKIDHRIDTV